MTSPQGDIVQSFGIDRKTYDLLVTLRSHVGVDNNPAVLRKAVALANIAAKAADRGFRGLRVRVQQYEPPPGYAS